MSATTSSGCDYSKEDNGYDSTNEDDTEARNAKRARLDLAEKPKHDRREKAKASSSVFSTEVAADEGRRQRVKLLQLNAYDRHKQLVNTYQETNQSILSTSSTFLALLQQFRETIGMTRETLM